MEKQPYWRNQAEMAQSCGVSRTAFQSWGVPPVAKIGRNVYYLVADVLANRMDHEFLGPNSKYAKISPGIAEYARWRIAGLEAQITKLEASKAK